MLYLLASILTLAVGPIFYHGFSHYKGLLACVSTFVVTAILGLVLFDILPDLLSTIGYITLPIILLGAAGPSFVEYFFHNYSRSTHKITVILGVIGLVIHTLTDGSAIYLVEQQQANDLLAIGIILHNFPAGLAIWWMFRSVFSYISTVLLLISIMLITILGFIFGHYFNAILSDSIILYLQAFVTGSIIHVLLHRPHEHNNNEKHQHHKMRFTRGNYIGLGFGLVFVVLLLLFYNFNTHHHHHHHDENHHHHHTH